MRFKIVFPVLVLGGLVALAALLLRTGNGPPQAGPRPLAPSAQPPATTPVKTALRPSEKRAQLAAPTSASPSNAPASQPADASHQAYVAARVSELMDLAMDNAPASLESILGELTNRDPEIRQAAVEAAMQFGSREAIPRLKEAVDQTEAPQEKVALLEAIEFLKLPSPSELSAQGKGPPGR